jgi:hypothetical protein
MFSFVFRVAYQTSCLNTVPDGLSRRGSVLDGLSHRSSDELLAATLSRPFVEMYVELRRTSGDTADLCELRDVISAGRPGAPLHVSDGLILYADGVSVPNSSALVPEVLKRAHTATHEGAHVWLRLFHRLAQSLVAGSRGAVRHTYGGQDTILERMGTVFYYLQPTVSAYLYNVFHEGVLSPL